MKPKTRCHGVQPCLRTGEGALEDDRKLETRHDDVPIDGRQIPIGLTGVPIDQFGSCGKAIERFYFEYADVYFPLTAPCREDPA